MQNILVIGANGTTGRLISKILRDSSDFKPFAMIRKETQKPFFENQGIETRHGDLEADFTSAFRGMDKVIFAAGSGGKGGDEKTIAVDQIGAIKAVEFAKTNKLQKFVMLSSMGTDNPSKIEGLEQYLESKKTADDFLRESNVVYTIVQPGGLTDKKGTEKVELAHKLKKMGEISREDVAHTLLYALELQRAKNTSFEIISGNDDLEQSIKNYK